MGEKMVAKNNYDDSVSSMIEYLQQEIGKMDGAKSSFDYIREDEENKRFDSYSLDVEKEAWDTIVKEITSNINEKARTREVIGFDINTEIGRNQVGIAKISELNGRLKEVLDVTSQPNSRLRITKEIRRQIFCYVVTLGKFKIIKKMNVVYVLSKSKKKINVGLSEKRIKAVNSEYIMFSPRSFDLICDEENAFIFSEKNFHFMFSGSEFLKSEINKNKDKLLDLVNTPEPLIGLADKNPAILRGIYHLVTSNKSFKPNMEKIESINNKIRAKTNSSEALLTLTDGKLNCTEQNSKYLYWYLAKKIGLNMVTDDLFAIGSSYPI